jgi:alkaline phosphatase D
MHCNPGRVFASAATLIFVFILAPSCVSLRDQAASDGPHQGTGIKIGEVTSTSAVVWTRGTRSDRGGVSLSEVDEWLNQTRRDFLLGMDWDDVLAPASESELTASAGEGGSMANEKPDDAKRLSKRDRDRIVQLSAVRGMGGEVEIDYRPADPAGEALVTRRYGVRDLRDYTRHIKLDNLQPGTKYEITVKMFKDGGEVPTSAVEASFRTAPAPEADKPVFFTVVTGQAFRNVDLRGEDFEGVNDASEHLLQIADPDEALRIRRTILGHRIYPVMMLLEPDFLIHTGDVVYYDHQGASATSMRMARVWWQRMFSLRANVGFCRKVPIYFMKDDHDTLKNDCWPGQRHGQLSYAEGRRVFHEQTPLSLERNLSVNDGETYRTVRWGKHLQVWFLETRDFRSPNTMDAEDPKKTMLGGEQIEWLGRTVRDSDATFKMVVCAVPIIGPDRPPEPTPEEKKALGIKNMFRPPRIDNLTNPTWHRERTRLLTEVFADIPNLILLVGDRHWKYHSAWPSRENAKIHEFSCGSTSDYHARTGLRMLGVPTPETDEMLYWRDEIEQGGFLSVRVEPGPSPRAVFRFHDTRGELVYPANTEGRRQVIFGADGRLAPERRER